MSDFRIISILLCCLLLFPFAQADDLDQSRQQLEYISKELKSLQSRLAKQNQDASKQRQALQQVESEIGRIQTGIRQLNSGIKANNSRLDELAAQRSKLEQRQAEKQDEMAEILRLAYKQNNFPLLKLILSGQRPEEMSRQLYYFSALTDNQQQQLTAWLEEQRLLAQTIEAETATRNKLSEDKAALTAQLNELSQQKNRREQVIANLKTETANTQAEIARKEAERERMTELIAQLQAKLDAMSLEFPGLEAIGKVKGKLSWPVAGKLVNQYGRSIDGTALKWQGWLIEASSGTEVKAIHGGRVIFADFFKSSGLLLIVDHGDGVWSLYGRNQALLKDVGSWVEAGEVIAEVGQSGGYSRSGLYFEFRIDGEPVNPSAWLSKR
ncbi:murein hydrolase activator EnvC family protein [Reinekea marinisedimentorum]|uniref:Septal ring factor EnvC (AmiA/AmiB activator) n=1 Tax=Reinekea marinisedimentorum TaxID=230495 RepID=A0A4R3I9D9_9GAMM|nr:peptidoglycan DD-metalloendopeptidase family protein [Reinekea marinisedimentorum]TCS43009.1 septal ring factor EnvC (AmiA/AmiB activator) [Reinekea marinisedimentorum]